MVGFVLAFLLGLVVADHYRQDSSLTTYQHYHEEHINLIVENTNEKPIEAVFISETSDCLLYTSPSPRDAHESRMPSSA